MKPQKAMELRKKMLRRIKLKITPIDVNEAFRAAYERYKNPSNGQSDQKEPAPLTRESVDRAVRSLRG